MELFRFAHNHEHYSVNRENIEKNRTTVGKLLIFACFFMYATSMAAKGVFAAESKYIKEIWNIADYSIVSMTNTFYFVTYGLVQILIFMFIKRINVRKYMIFSIPFAAVSMILMGLAENIYVMWVFFGLTGAFQAGIYCGCTYMLTENLPTKLLSPANKIMNVGYAFGTLVSYGLCGLCVSFDLWRVPYFLLGGLFLVSVVIFTIIVTLATRYKRINRKLDKKVKLEKKANKALEFEDKPLFTLETKKKIVLFYVVDMIMSFFITCLFYMVMNYITSLLVDVHGLSDGISIYVSMLAPASIAIGPIIAITMCDHDRDFIREGLYMLFALLPIAFLLAFFYDSNVIVALGLSLLFVIVANGVKTVVLSVMSFRMRKIINSGAYSAISNALASLAAGIAPTISGIIIDAAGWRANYFAIAGLIVALIIATIIIDRIVRKSYAVKYGINNNKI